MKWRLSQFTGQLFVLPIVVSFVLFTEFRISKADDWPQWRGPMRDGVYRETEILTKIPSDGLRVRWRTRIHQGYSGPSVAGGKVFVSDRRINPDREGIICINEQDGTILWQHEYPCEYGDMEYGNGPRTTPTIFDGKVYTLGTKAHLYCYAASTGNVIWNRDLKADYHAREPRYGVSAAPIIEEDFLIVLVGGEDGSSIVAFDRLTGEERWRSLDDRQAYSAPIVVDHDGTRQLIVWSAEHVSSLDPATGKVHWQVPFKVTFDDAQVVASAVLRDKQLLCMGAWGRGSMMLSLDPKTLSATQKWRTGKTPTTTFATPWFPAGKHFYSSIGGGGIGCYLVENGDEVWSTLEMTGERNGTAHITPIGEGDQKGKGGRAFLFNQKGQLILAQLTPEGHREIGRCLLVEASAGYRPQGPIAWSHPAYANRSVFARNDRELVCASLAESDYSEAQTLQRKSTSIEPVRTLKNLSGRSSALGIALSPDGILTAAGTWIGEIKLVNNNNNKELPAPKKHRYSATKVAFSPDGAYLVSVGGNEFQKNAEIVIWDIAKGKELARIAGHEDKIYSAAYSPDGKRIATASADHTVRLWNFGATLQEVAVLEGHRDAVLSLAFSPDSKTFVSAGWDGKVRLWNAVDGSELGEFSGHSEEILCVAVSPDGKHIATGSTDWMIKVWDFPDRKERATLSGHRGAVYDVVFSPDGKTLASGSGDETIRLWNIENLDAIDTREVVIRGHNSGITDLEFSPDGKELLSAGRDDPVRVWRVVE